MNKSVRWSVQSIFTSLIGRSPIGIVLSFFFVTTGCGNLDLELPSLINPTNPFNPIVKITSPSTNSYLGAAGISAVTVTGTCSENGRSVVLSGAISATATCTGNAFAVAVDFSAVADGGLTLNANHTSSKGISATQDTVNFVKDIQPPNAVTFSSPASSFTLGATSYSFAWSTTDLGLSGMRTGNTYQIKQFNNGTCTGGGMQTSLATASTLNFSSMADGSTYSLEVTAYDNANNASTPVCSPAITINMSAPTLALSDGTTSSTTHVRQVTTVVSVGNDATAVKWCLSETQNTAPANGSATCNGGGGASSGWYIARPTSINLSVGDGLKTVYIWTADVSDNVGAMTVSDTITLDTTLPANPTVSMSDPTTSSTAYTNQTPVNLSITSDTDAVAWCSIEQANAAAAPSAPLYNNACWVGTRPTTQILSATGVRKIYVYTKDVASNVSSAASVATIDYSSTAPAAPTLALSDGTTSSTTHVRQVATAVSIGSDAAAVKWCISETQTSAPTSGSASCVGGVGPANGWHTARPTTTNVSSGDGLKTVYVWIADQYNNVNSTATFDTITLDTIVPTVTVNQKAGQSDPTTATPILFTITFSEAVTGLTATDFTVGGTSSVTAKSLTGSGSSYELSIDTATSGTIIVSLPANTALDVAGNNSAASTSTDNTVTYNNSLPNDPQRLHVAKINASRVVLSWDNAGPAATDYVIAYQTGTTPPANCTSGTVIPDTVVDEAVLFHVLDGLSAYTDYAARICAKNVSGLSAGRTIVFKTLPVCDYNLNPGFLDQVVNGGNNDGVESFNEFEAYLASRSNIDNSDGAGLIGVCVHNLNIVNNNTLNNNFINIPSNTYIYSPNFDSSQFVSSRTNGADLWDHSVFSCDFTTNVGIANLAVITAGASGHGFQVGDECVVKEISGGFIDVEGANASGIRIYTGGVAPFEKIELIDGVSILVGGANSTGISNEGDISQIMRGEVRVNQSTGIGIRLVYDFTTTEISDVTISSEGQGVVFDGNGHRLTKLSNVDIVAASSAISVDSGDRIDLITGDNTFVTTGNSEKTIRVFGSGRIDAITGNTSVTALGGFGGDNPVALSIRNTGQVGSISGNVWLTAHGTQANGLQLGNSGRLLSSDRLHVRRGADAVSTSGRAVFIGDTAAVDSLNILNTEICSDVNATVKWEGNATSPAHGLNSNDTIGVPAAYNPFNAGAFFGPQTFPFTAPLAVGAQVQGGMFGGNCIVANQPAVVPTSIALQTPASSPSNVTTPTIRVSGVHSGLTAKLYTNSHCAPNFYVGSASANGSFVDVTSSALTSGYYEFYAATVNASGVQSACSYAAVPYDLDATAPTVTNVTSTTTNGTYKTSDVINVQITFSENVTVTGTPRIQLETGTTDQYATYTSGSGTNILNFSYTVQSGDTSSDLNYVATNSLGLNGGTINDAVNNAATLTLPALASANSLATNKNIVIDAVSPTVTVNQKSGQADPTTTLPVLFTITFSESVTGLAAADFTIGGTSSVTAKSLTGSGSSYELSIDTATTGTVTASLSANAAQDAVGNNSAASTSTDNTVTISPPIGNFNITGITGGTDSTVDAWLSNGVTPVINWQNATNEASYDVTVYEYDGTTVKCATQNVVADTTSYNFSSCNLTNLTSYKAKVVAKDAGSGSQAATNDMFVFTVSGSQTAPSAFTITGITGGADNAADNNLTDGNFATVRWNNTLGENSYDVTIYENDGTTVKCATQNVAADTTSYNFSGCSLTSGSFYRAKVVAKDAGSGVTTATNSTYRFYIGMQLENVYAIKGADWNDYVKNNNGGTTVYNQPDVECDGTEVGELKDICIHGGEKKKVALTRASCTGLTMSDALGAFDWICDDTSGNAIVYSVGLKKGKGLKDLVNSASWKNNQLTVMDGATQVFQSSSSVWWGNPVVALAANTAIGSAPIQVSGARTIYTVDTSRATSGYNLNVDKSAFVTLPGVTLTYNGRANTCGQLGDFNIAPDSCIVASKDQKFLWIEGDFVGSGNNEAVQGNFSYSVIRLVTATGNSDGIYSWGGKSNYFSQITANSNNVRGMFIEYDSGKLTFEDITTNNNSDSGFWWQNCVGGTGRGLTAKNNNLGPGYGVIIYNCSSKVRLDNIISLNNQYGVALDSANAHISNVYISGNRTQGISSSYNNDGLIITGVKALNNWTSVFLSNDMDDITVTNVLDANSVYAVGVGGGSTDSGRNTWSHITAVNHGYGIGIFNNSTGYNTAANILLSANGQNAGGFGGLGIDSSNNKLNNIAIANVFEDGLKLNSSSSNTFSGNLLIGSIINAGSNCAVTGGTNPGIVNGTCATQGASSHNYVSGIDTSQSFIGKIMSDDTSNTNDSSGIISFSSIVDFGGFENPFRGWGKDGAYLAEEQSNHGWCQSGDICRIWDWRLKATDNTVRNRTGTGNSANDPFISGSACPAAIDASISKNVITDQKSSSPNTFLVNAQEIIMDGIGDDDGLCESNEACIYSPNFGAYQGEGNYLSNGTCTFSGGNGVTSVTMYAYPTNGATYNPPSPPVNPVLSLADSSSGSVSYTDNQLITVSVTNDATAVKWCMSETQTTAPASGSAVCDGGWQTVRPNSFGLSAGSGNKTVYLWVADSLDAVNPGAVTDVIMLDAVNPSLAGSITLSSAYNSTTDSPNMSWSAASDAHSGVAYYELMIRQTTACTSGTILLNFTNIGNVTNYQQTGLTLTNGTSYCARIRAVDNSGRVSTIITGTWTVDTVAPSMASSLQLITPATSPGNDTTPTIRVNGVSTGDTVKIYTDGSCNVLGLKGSGTAVGTSIDIDTSPALASDAPYTYKAEIIDPAGNSSGCSTATVSYTLDTAGPTVTVNQKAGQVDPAGGTPVSFTVTFNESVTGLTAGDFTVGGTATTCGSALSGSGASYQFDVNCVSANGTIVVSLAANAAQDTAGNNSAASTSTDNTVTFTGITAFTVSGVRGGSDVTTDAWLNGNSDKPTIYWTDATNEVSYDVTVYEMDGTTIKCATQNVAANTTSYNFSSCGLTDKTSYKAIVAAKDNGSGTKAATNNPYIFTYYAPTSITMTITSNADDGHIVEYANYSNGIGGTLFQSAIKAGDDSSWQNYYAFFRFTLPQTLPVNTQITSATLRLYGTGTNNWNNSSDTLFIKVQDTADAGQVNNKDDFPYDAGGTKLAYQDETWPASGGLNWNTSGWNTSNDFSNAVQEVVDKYSGLANGSHIQLWVANEKNGTNRQVFAKDFSDGGGNYAELTLTSVMSAPTRFKILGVTGGSDLTKDARLTSGVNPTINWENALGETSYDVTVFEDDGTTVKCATQSVAANTTSYNFSGCNLTSGNFYRAYVAAEDANGSLTNATGGQLRFKVGLEVEPVYFLSSEPTNAWYWTRYLNKSDPSLPNYKQPDNIWCIYDQSKTQYEGCVHIGEMRKMATNESSCAGLTASDNLGAFDWVCEASSGNAVFYSTGLKSGKGLRDLVNAASWKNMQLTVMNGVTQVVQSTLAAWWTNPVVALPNNSSTSDPLIVLDGTDDDGAGPDQVYADYTVFTLSSSRASSGYGMTAGHMSLVTLPGATLSYSGRAANNFEQTYGSFTSGQDTRCLVGVQSWMTWVEGDFDGEAGANDADFGYCNVWGWGDRINNATFSNNTKAGLYFHFNGFYDITNVTASNNKEDGIKLAEATYPNYLYNITANNNSSGSAGNGIKVFYCAGTNRGAKIVKASTNSNYSHGILFTGCDGSKADDVMASLNGEAGVSITSNSVTLTRARVTKNGAWGVSLNYSWGAVLSQIVAYNNALVGISNNTAVSTTVTNSILANNANQGYLSAGDDAHHDTLSHLTVVNNGSGIRQVSTINGDNTFAQILLVNSSSGSLGEHGLYLRAPNNKLANIVVTNQNNQIPDYGIYLNGSSTNTFSENLIVGSNETNCKVTGGTNPGLIDGTCANQGSSSANLITGKDLSSSFVGKITADDLVNISDVNGALTHNSITDWLGFENIFRTWGKEGGTFAVWDNARACGAGDTCRIWDWRLKSTDTAVLNKSYDGTNANGAFSVGSTCPAAVNGNKTITDSLSRTFLINATELMFDAVRNPNGNNNGLCESGEGCLYSPNFGAYQGEGSLSAGTCTFQNGTVTGVQMYSYTTNGI